MKEMIAVGVRMQKSSRSGLGGGIVGQVFVFGHGPKIVAWGRRDDEK